MIPEALKVTNTLAGLPRALTEDEHKFYNATLTLAATLLEQCLLEARMKAILMEKQYDELSDSFGNSGDEDT